MKTARHSRENFGKTPQHAADLAPSVEWDKSNADPAPSVTVFTNMAGAVSVTVDRESSTDAARRLSSRLLPENLFNPFRDCRSKRRQHVPPMAKKSAAAAGIPEQNPHITSAAAAAIAVEGIKKGVRDALDQWALQTSRRESMVLWRHECSRYASSSRIGYHPNHPSASHPSSRPSSATTILRPFSAGRVPQQSYHHDHHHQQQRASSAFPPRSQPLGEESGMYEAGQNRAAVEEGAAGRGDIALGTRPRSAIPRLLGADAAESDDNNTRPKRGVSASAARGNAGGVDATSTRRRRGGSGSSARRRRAMRSASTTRSQSPLNNQDRSSVEGGEGDDVFDDIYEDLEEDDGELEARISIMESRFSTVGRERPGSAADDGDATAGDGGNLGAERQRWSGPRRTGAPDAPRSAATQRPPRAPPQQQQQQQMFSRSRPARRHVTSSAKTGGTQVGEDSGEQQRLLLPVKTSVSGQQRHQPPRVIRSRPTSAPVGGSSLPQQRQRGGGAVNDPMAPLHARRMRLQMSSGGSRPPAEPEQGGGGGGGEAGVDTRSDNRQRRRSSVRDVKTAVPSWDRNVDGGNRPLSSATDGAPGAAAAAGCADKVADGNTEEGREHLKPNEITTPMKNHSRPSSAAFRGWIKARPGARSAVSAVSSARTLGMDDPELVHLQLEMESRRGGMSESTLARMEDHYTAVVLKNTSAPRPSQRQAGRPTPPQKKKGGASSRSRGKGASSKGRSKSPRKGRKKKGGSGGKKKSGKRGGAGAGAGDAAAASGKVYTSAGAFMAEHFPSEEKQGVSLLGMEQEEECRNASEALSRAGLSVSSEALRRALVIPTDRPLETCLAGLPHPTEGLHDAPFPPPPSLTALGHHRPPSLLLSSSPLGSRSNVVGTGPGLGKKGGGGGVARRRSPSPAGSRRGVRGRGKRSPVGGGGRKKKSPTRR
ncbi:unnamed protein product [Ectocarpus fasciculatus]